MDSYEIPEKLISMLGQLSVDMSRGLDKKVFVNIADGSHSGTWEIGALFNDNGFYKSLGVQVSQEELKHITCQRVFQHLILLFKEAEKT